MTKEAKTVWTILLMIVAVAMAVALLHVRREQGKVFDRVNNDIREQQRFDGYDPDRGVVKVQIVK